MAEITDWRGPVEPDIGLVEALAGDGRPLLSLTGLLLVLSGLFAIFQSLTGHFLPHDVAYLGMTSRDLCGVNECRIVHFMFHDRVSFGGSLIGIGVLYLWLAAFPLRHGAAWAWWVFLLSGVFGFASFLTYLGYGYLDTWHGVATLALLPLFAWGLFKTYSKLMAPRSLGCLFRAGERLSPTSLYGFGKICLLAMAACLFVGGLIIMSVGVTTVFVPQDLSFMRISVDELHAINPRLVPLIAHDRAGFGGGVACCGAILFFCLWCGHLSRSLWQAVFVTGFVGFGTAIGVHPAIGYIDAIHLAPACIGAALFLVGITLTFRRTHSP
jgi:hypothetical protein